MRKQLHEVQEIDQYLLGNMAVIEKLLFQAKMILSTELKLKVIAQSEAHTIIREYARKEKREHLETIYQGLYKEEAFRKTIHSIFK